MIRPPPCGERKEDALEPHSEPDLEPMMTLARPGVVSAVAAPDHPAERAEDRALANRLVAGDPDALAELYDRYAPVVLGLARRVLRDPAAAEDVAQEVFVYAWREAHRYDTERGSLKAWLGVVAYRRSLDRVRAAERRTRHEGRVAAEPVSGGDPLAHGHFDDQVARQWLAEKVRRAVERLPIEQRRCVELAYYGGRSYRDVAAELSIPEGTAKSRLRLALAKLEELLRVELGTEVTGWA